VGDNGTVKVSVEDMLYYAPQYSDAGSSLGDKLNDVRNQLTSMGNFWGDDPKFGQPFGQQYQPAQQRIFQLVSTIVSGLGGIADGVQKMAQNYGVTESDVQQQMTRIQNHQRFINHKDGN
jgi:uncharacterized protein YukE